MKTTHWCRCCGFVSTDGSQYVFRHTDPDDSRNPALCGDCIRRELEKVSGIEAAFKSGGQIIVVAREMSDVDFNGLVNAETTMCIDISVRARQKRSIDDVCGAPWHPATGAWYGPRTRSCYRCVVELWTWFRRRLKSKPRGGGPSFYDHVVFGEHSGCADSNE